MDNTKVYTETTCGMCSKLNRREGEESFFPPVNWAEVTLMFRHEGSGWTNNTRYENQLCPECAKKIRDVIFLPNTYKAE